MKRVIIVSVACCVSAALSFGCRDKNTMDDGRMTTSVSSSASASAKPTFSTSADGQASSNAVYPAIDTDQAITAAEKEAAAKATAARAEVEPSKAPGDDDVKGVVEFAPAAGGVSVHYRITGLTPGKHG